MNPITQSKQSDAQPTPKPGLPRCSHRTPAGRHCRAQARDSRTGLCPRHYFRAPEHRPDPALANELLGPLTDFNSAHDVTDFLARLLILQAKDRIAPRRAAVMAYTCNLLLRGIRAIDLENQAIEEEPPQVIWDLARPFRAPISDSTGLPVPDSTNVRITTPSVQPQDCGGQRANV